METSFRIGRFHGIDVGVNWSVLVIAGLVAWGLAEVTLPANSPGYRTSAYWFAAVAAMVLFFACLLAHEFAHSLVAQHYGVGVDRITLWLFGGVSLLRSDSPSARSELRIAIVGPLVSLALAAIFGTLAGAFALVDAPHLATAACGWLGAINAMLALFNLAPAAPLDGGRVLRAVVWARTGDRARASIVAARAGRGFGYLLVAAGIAMAFAGAFSGLWLSFLGWFLLNAARAEETHVLLEGALAGIRVRDVMTRDPVTAPAHISVAELVDDFILRHPCSAFPLVEHGRVVGLVTLRQARAVPAARRATTTVESAGAALGDVALATPDELLTAVLPRMGGARGDGRLLVMEGERLVGIVSPTDVNRALEVAALRA